MSHRKTIVIFVFTQEEAKFALNYKKLHPQQNIKILVGSLIAHIWLLRNSVSPFDYDQLLYQNKKQNYYQHITWCNRQGKQIYEQVKSKLVGIDIVGINLVEVLQYLLETEFTNVIYAFDLFKKIQTRWKPDFYYFSQGLTSGITGWDPDHFAIAALFADFFCQPEKIVRFDADFKIPRNLVLSQLRKILSSPKSIINNCQALFYRWLHSKKPYVNTKKIDFLLYSIGFNLYYYHRLFTLLDQYPYKKLNYFIVTGEQGLEHELLLRKKDISFTPLNFFTNNEMTDKTQAGQDRIRLMLKEKLSDPELIYRLFPMRFSLVYKKALYHKLRLILTSYNHKFIQQTILADTVIKKVQPKLVVTTHDPGPSALPFVFLAKKAKIPSLVLLHGYPDLSFDSNYQSDYIASWGGYFKKEFIRQLHKKPDSVISVGFPFVDELFTNLKFTKKESGLIPKFKHPLHLAFLLTLYRADPFVIPNFLTDLFKSIKLSQLKIDIYLRTHPGQHLDGLNKAARFYGIKYFHDQLLSLDNFVMQSDIVFSWDTTAILWPMIYGKPLFYSNPYWQEGYIPIKQYQAAWVPKSADDLIKWIKRLQKKPELVLGLRSGQQKFLKDILGEVNGFSTNRLIEVLSQLKKEK